MAVIRLPITEYKELNLRAQKAEELEKTNTELIAHKNHLEQEVQTLKELIRLERIKKYGRKSEALSDGQLELLEEKPSVEEAELKDLDAVNEPKKLQKDEWL